MSTNRFQDRSVIVTGAGSGMGRATSQRFASEGAKVFAADIDASALAETSQLVKDAGGTIETATCDVSQRAQCFDVVARCVEVFGALHVLANVAGILRFSHAHEMSEEEWQLVLGVNLSGPFFLSQAAIPHLLETKGNIVNVASNAGLMGQSYAAAYSASKGGLVNLTRELAIEYLKQGIRINAVAPGGTDTNMMQDMSMPEGVDLKILMRNTVPRPNSKPEEIASVIAFLASDEASSVHGAIWSVDNGLTA